MKGNIAMDALKKLLSQSVPLISGVIGTASPIAGVLFSAIAHLFGLNTNSTPEELATAISADPDHDIKLKQIEITHQNAILDSITQIRMAAYNRESSVVKSTGRHDWIMEAIAILMVVGFFSMCFIITFCTLGKSDTNLLYLVIGQFSTGFITVLSYYFGATNQRSYLSASASSPGLPAPAQTS